MFVVANGIMRGGSGIRLLVAIVRCFAKRGHPSRHHSIPVDTFRQIPPVPVATEKDCNEPCD